MCIRRYIAETCGCITMSHIHRMHVQDDELLQTMPNCLTVYEDVSLTTDMMQCERKAMENFTRTTYLTEVCKCAWCCDEQVYEVGSYSMNKWPAEKKLVTFLKTMLEDSEQENLRARNIYKAVYKQQSSQLTNSTASDVGQAPGGSRHVRSVPQGPPLKGHGSGLPPPGYGAGSGSDQAVSPGPAAPGQLSSVTPTGQLDGSQAPIGQLSDEATTGVDLLSALPHAEETLSGTNEAVTQSIPHHGSHGLSQDNSQVSSQGKHGPDEQQGTPPEEEAPTLPSATEEEIEWVEKSFVHVNLYFNDVIVQQQEQVVSLSLADLWSSVGGVLGLWAGISIITVVEIVNLLITIVTLLVAKIKNRNKVHF